MFLGKRTPQRAPELLVDKLAANDSSTSAEDTNPSPIQNTAPTGVRVSTGSPGATPVTTSVHGAPESPVGQTKQSGELHRNTAADRPSQDSDPGSNTATTISTFSTTSITDTGSSTSSGGIKTSGSSSGTASSWSAPSESSSITSSSWSAPTTNTPSSSVTPIPSSTTVPWSSNPPASSTTSSWTTNTWENKEVTPASTSSDTWYSEWSQPSSESTSSWSETFWSSSISSSSLAQAYPTSVSNAVPQGQESAGVQSHSAIPAAKHYTSSGIPSVEIPGPTPSIAETLTNMANPVASSGLITNKHVNSSLEAAVGGSADGQTKKVGNMDAGPFAGLLVGILLIAIVAYLIGDKWHKKKTGYPTPLWQCIVDKFRDRDPNEGKRPFTQFTTNPFTDELEKSHYKKKRSPVDNDGASSFFNSSRSSKWLTPVTPLEPNNLAGRGGNVEPFSWLAPPPPAMNPVPPAISQHPRASRYMPTSGRLQQTEILTGRTEPSRVESDEILANYDRDSAYESLADYNPPKRFDSTKRKTTATTMTEGSVYSVDSIWGNASEAPPTARSSLRSSFLPWRRSNSIESPATQLPAVPAIPAHLAYQAPGQAHTGGSNSSRFSRLRKSASYDRLQDAAYQPEMPRAPPAIATHGPPKPAMAQTPIGVKQNPRFGTGGFVLPLGGFSR
ncbi:hypothetical protein QFC19_008438 [Naganishia cerealis]|uniref:Uncharacterized protein n=1 Tax=Naganishia cerealis TaxID=610337 RepID=A0ACC2V1W5_9TREE|nr:hypothetical protein QFC19_008438 [Naganishia cerealis]